MYEEATLDIVWSRINEEVYSKERNSNYYHVSEILPNFYPKYFKYLKQTEQQKTLNFFTGNLLHSFAISKTMNEIELKADLEKMTPLFDDKPPVSRKCKCLLGKFDDMIEIIGEKIILDKKTTNNIPEQMPNYYYWQLNLYKLLIFIHYKIDIKFGQIVFFDVSRKFYPSVRERPLLKIPIIRKIALDLLEKKELGTI